MRTRFLATGILATGLMVAILIGKSFGQPAKTEAPSAIARFAAAERVCEMLHDPATGAPAGHDGVEHAYLWSMRRMEAQRDVAAATGDHLSALESHLQRMREFEAGTAKLNKEGVASKFELASTQFYVAEAEELLARARAK